MASAMDVAKFFMREQQDPWRGTYDGNMKLQKLLFFADLISLAENGERLFPEPIRAFKNGCVVESVRLRYRNDFDGFYADSMAFNPDFTQAEYDALKLTSAIFGHLSARDLSDVNHTFSFWREAYERSQRPGGYKDKDLAIVQEDQMRAELDKVRTIVDAHKSNRVENPFREIINGKVFFYSADFEMTDSIIDQLDDFSRYAEEDAYSVYIEDDNLVVV